MAPPLPAVFPHTACHLSPSKVLAALEILLTVTLAGPGLGFPRALSYPVLMGPACTPASPALLDSKPCTDRTQLVWSPKADSTLSTQ